MEEFLPSHTLENCMASPARFLLVHVEVVLQDARRKAREEEERRQEEEPLALNLVATFCPMLQKSALLTVAIDSITVMVDEYHFFLVKIL